jgi:hypothetical protein
MRLTLCLVTWNELEGCKIDVPRLKLDQFEEVYAIDGGSTDGTVEYLQSQGITVYRQPEPSLNAACVHAFEKCTTDALIFFHPKASIPADDVLRFRTLFEKGYQLVIASRNMAGARNEEDGKFLKPRKWFVEALSLTAAFLWRRRGPVVWDVLHGFRGMTVQAFRRIHLSRRGMTVDLEMVARAYRLGIPYVEFPTQESPRPFGETHFKAFPTGVKLLRFILSELRRSRRQVQAAASAPASIGELSQVPVGE